MTTTLEQRRHIELMEPRVTWHDEMWEGVLFMPPSPNTMHQKLRDHLVDWLRRHWEDDVQRRVYGECNLIHEKDVGNWTWDYRVPDMLLLDGNRFHQDRGVFVCGPPLVVLEVRSIGERTDEKLTFYTGLCVPEVWIIDRSSRHPEIFLFHEERHTSKPFDADGWLRSPATGVEFRRSDDGKLRVRMNGDDATIDDLPRF